jgi:CIC family chloride channel protein
VTGDPPTPSSTKTPPDGKLKLLRRLRWRIWRHERLRLTEWQTLLLWAAAIGLLSGFVAGGFKEVLNWVHTLFTGWNGDVVESFDHLPPWRRLVTPALGGAAAGAVLLLGRRLARPKSTTDYMEAIGLGNGRIPVRASLLKSVAATFSIASGGSIGREGPMVQLASMASSIVGRAMDWPEQRLRLLAACGASAGVAAAYHAPIAGALFVAEIILGTLQMETLGPLVVSAVAAMVSVRIVGDAQPLYPGTDFALASPWELLPYAALGMLAGIAAPIFIGTLRKAEQAFSKLEAPGWIKLALGGLGVGIIAIWVPGVCGNGQSVINDIFSGHRAGLALVALVLCKWAATSASFGSGAVGGIFTPTLFMGASLGHLFGEAVHRFWPQGAVDPRAFALVGTGAFLAAATRVPLMAVAMMFELTLSYDIMLPLLLASTVAWFTAGGSDKPSLYQELLRRKAEAEPEPRVFNVAPLIRPDPPRVALTDTLEKMAKAFLGQRINNLYVVDSVGAFRGVVPLEAVKPFLDQPEMASVVIAADIMESSFPTVSPDASLGEASASFATHPVERLPVVEAETRRLLGGVSRNDLLLAIAEEHRRRRQTDSAKKTR